MQTPEALRNLIEPSERIVITSHFSPDPDAICSLLLLRDTLKHNYPKKLVAATLEDEVTGLEDIPNISTIEQRPLVEAVRAYRPDLLIITDTNRIGRVTRLGAEMVAATLRELGTRTATIDHHDPTGKDMVDYEYIDPQRPAATEMVYDVCFNKLDLKRPDGYGLLALIGIVADTGGLRFGGKDYSLTRRILSDLESQGLTIEHAEKILNRLSSMQQEVVRELENNIVVENGYVYSFVNDATRQRWLDAAESPMAFKTAKSSFVNRFVHDREDVEYGFVVTPNVSLGAGTYDVSFRSKPHTVNVAKICQRISGGGGHENAAGTVITADSLDAAIATVKQVLADSH